MGSGLFFGLAAALCWGVADFCARGASRAGGTFLTLLAIQVVAVVAFLLVGLPLGLIHLGGPAVGGPAVGGLALGPVLAAAGISLAIMAGAAFLYRAFAIGKVALASPIAASFAAITALLALATGERPAPPQLVGIVLTLGGVILASSPAEEREPQASARAQSGRFARLEPGLIEALLAMLIFGVAYWALRFVVGPLGGVEVAFIAKVADLVVLGALAGVGVLLSRGRLAGSAPGWLVPRWPPRVFWLFVVPTALLDTAANIAYNVGITQALVSVVVVLSSLFSAVTVLLAWIFLRERLRGWQWLGVGAIFAGIALVSM